MLGMAAEQINVNLKEHQGHVHEWNYSSLAKNLHVWAERFVLEFKLQCTVPALRLDGLRSNCYGYFRIGRNGFGLLNEIAINDKHINGAAVDFQVCGTLLHELLHSEQQALNTEGQTAKRRNYHKGAFIKRAKYFGLIVDHGGHQEYAPPPTRFSQLLDKYGIEVPTYTDNEASKIRTVGLVAGNSKLKLWICSCKPKPVHVRVAVPDFRARCLKCNQLFVRRDY